MTSPPIHVTENIGKHFGTHCTSYYKPETEIQSIAAVSQCSRCSYKGPTSTFPLRKNGNGNTRVCCACTDKKAAAREKENIDKGKGSRTGTGAAQPSLLAFDECLTLISMNRDEAFELDTFVVLPEEMKGDGLSVHEFANGFRDRLASASDYHWK
jgi:hypothetical protein